MEMILLSKAIFFRIRIISHQKQHIKMLRGVYGFSAHQGFYVYRGNRLLLAGDWLGLMRKEESYKLVRIQVDLQNTVDSDWQIDIKNQKHILQWVVGYS